MRLPTAATATVILAAALTACGSSDDPATDSKSTPAASSSAPALTAEQRASIAAAVGLPPAPDADSRKAYLDALAAIDPRIAKAGKDDQTVDRGRNQCASIKNSPDDENKLAGLALDRFTVTTRLPEIATLKTGASITEAAHKHLCPTF